MLIENSIRDALEWDQKENKRKKKANKKTPTLQSYKQPFDLPGKLNGVIQPDTVEVVKNLWEIYSTVTCMEPPQK